MMTTIKLRVEWVMQMWLRNLRPPVGSRGQVAKVHWECDFTPTSPIWVLVLLDRFLHFLNAELACKFLNRLEKIEVESSPSRSTSAVLPISLSWERLGKLVLWKKRSDFEQKSRLRKGSHGQRKSEYCCSNQQLHVHLTNYYPSRSRQAYVQITILLYWIYYNNPTA